MATSKDGYTHNADGTYSYKGKVIAGAKSLGQARQMQASGPKGGISGGSVGLPSTSSKAFSDPSAAYNAQFQNNPAWAAQGNLIQNGNQSDPFSSTQFTVDPNTGQITKSTQISDANRNVATGIQNNAQRSNANLYNNVLSGGALNGFAGSSTPGQAATSDPYTEAVFGQLTNHLNQNYQQQKQDKAQELQNRGIPMGSDEWTREMKTQVDQPYNDAIQQAQNQAVTSGASMQNQAAQTLQGIGTQGYMTNSGAPQTNAVNASNMYTTPGQLGQVFGTLANQNLSAQAQMVGAQNQGMMGQAALQNSDTNKALQLWILQHGGGTDPSNPTQPGGTGAPTN